MSRKDTRETLFIYKPSLLLFPMDDIVPFEHKWGSVGFANSNARLVAYASASAYLYTRNWKVLLAPAAYAALVFFMRNSYMVEGDVSVEEARSALDLPGKKGEIESVRQPINPVPFGQREADAAGASGRAFKSKSVSFAESPADSAFGNTMRPNIYTVRDPREGTGYRALSGTGKLERRMQGQLDQPVRTSRAFTTRASNGATSKPKGLQPFDG
jgi:hypothetical protein